MKNSLKLFLVLFIIFIVAIAGIRTFSGEDSWICVNDQWTKHGNPSTPMPKEFCQKSCVIDSDCKTPEYFLVQSNCPFDSVCIRNQCAVICPMVDSCEKDSDCNCYWRGQRSLECRCLENKCASVEA